LHVRNILLIFFGFFFPRRFSILPLPNTHAI
jgi:hypothetical protein